MKLKEKLAIKYAPNGTANCNNLRVAYIDGFNKAMEISDDYVSIRLNQLFTLYNDSLVIRRNFKTLGEEEVSEHE